MMQRYRQLVAFTAMAALCGCGGGAPAGSGSGGGGGGGQPVVFAVQRKSYGSRIRRNRQHAGPRSSESHSIRLVKSSHNGNVSGVTRAVDASPAAIIASQKVDVSPSWPAKTIELPGMSAPWNIVASHRYIFEVVSSTSPMGC